MGKTSMVSAINRMNRALLPRHQSGLRVVRPAAVSESSDVDHRVIY